VPDPYERHSRNSWEWGPAPARGQTRAAAADQGQGLAPAKRPPAKKDKSLCKAAHWKGPHTPEPRLQQSLRPRCGWEIAWDDSRPRYFCYHEAVCTGCGKITSTSISFGDCPDSRPLTPERRAEIELEIRRREERTAEWRAHRQVIEGTQGYRRKKETDVQHT
jgi:hypothetical protein